MTSEPRRALPAFPALRWSFSAGRELEEELLDPKKTSNSTHFISPHSNDGAPSEYDFESMPWRAAKK
ncbi:hypothetical protein [Xanthomonas oryzae]|uniref:hypothetical protein n=1 Tax=Xanthomonas oryzae TaxID=347 RepID=UPI00117F0251|nr:hypothetical protein [Xanthomonas oryzae]MEC5080697.1 hypothetical protein [Xanthomonas oryzae pv. oryzicola]MEC5115527.1 hypothetical protein [Xanthomonas oryzae pv. oryzicola]ULX24532.1 hypothetical protein IYN96_20735 [Xanthomonas oryzae pv. oryzicola]UNW42589.1 hypothetical protein H4J00_20945 [Xanthomonas oryzae pv. oryzicola]